MNKVEELAKLKQEMEEDKNLPLRTSETRLVFGEGNPDAELYFIGEGPGYNENLQGRPFVGQAGKLLNRTLELIGLKREDVYISNIVRFRPPENRDPLPEEIQAFQPYVDREIEIINPPVIVTLGRFSMGKFLPGEKISQIHGKPRELKWKGKDVTIVPMYHPAAALRASAVMQQFVEDFKKLPQILEKVKEKNKTQPEQMELV
ncbi:MAG: uracil-DNA glycosylase [Candidatus Blackburnbacteria bacterium]|nr:uracil-DNA glycosylase [Candidatus Blackburnbacteria bacterium]